MKLYDPSRVIGNYVYKNHKKSEQITRIFRLILIIINKFGGKKCSKYIQITSPLGDQPKAIEYLAKGIEEGKQFQTLLGVTGSRKNLHNGKCNRKSTKTYTRFST